MSTTLFSTWRGLDDTRKNELKAYLPAVKNPCTNPKKLVSFLYLEPEGSEFFECFWTDLLENPSFPAEGIRFIYNKSAFTQRYIVNIVNHLNTPADVLDSILNDLRSGKPAWRTSSAPMGLFDVLTHPNTSWDTYWGVISRNQHWIGFYWELTHSRFPEQASETIANMILEATSGSGVTAEGIHSMPLPVLWEYFKATVAVEEFR